MPRIDPMAVVDKLLCKLDRLIDATEYRQSKGKQRRIPGLLQSATGVAATDIIQLGCPPLGTIWEIEILATECTGAGAIATLYVEAITPLHKADTFNGAANVSRNYGAAPITVNHNSQVYVVFTGATAANPLYAVAWVKQITMPAAHSIGPHDNDDVYDESSINDPTPAPRGEWGTGALITDEHDEQVSSHTRSREQRDKVA